jgi:hypothetical protein
VSRELTASERQCQGITPSNEYGTALSDKPVYVTFVSGNDEALFLPSFTICAPVFSSPLCYSSVGYTLVSLFVSGLVYRPESE